jgi:hypothetical protein
VRRKVIVGLAALAATLMMLTGDASAHMGGGGSFSCRASGLRIAHPVLATEPVVANPSSVPCKNDFKKLDAVIVAPYVAVGVVTATTTVKPGGVPGGKAESAVATVRITVGTTVITAQVLSASATAGCAIENGMPLFTGSSQIVGLQINGGGVISGSNTATIPINPLLTVYLNRQFITNNAVLTQRALEISSPALNLSVVFGEAIADVESCQPILT